MGDFGQIKGFIVTEIEEFQQCLTLDLPPTTRGPASNMAQVPFGYRLRLTGVQAALAWHDPAANRQRFDAVIGAVADCDVLMLPEMFTTGFTMAGRAVAEPAGGPTTDWLTARARSLNALVGASVVTAAAEAAANRFLVADPSGAVSYADKRHLFRMAV